ncbi:hypothetical protein A7A78_01915 [Aequorivita soesokkakensis]|uniref:Uncharacterized protein n=1 Tax=Aequorivita soesokkakensis TaxID=1385699 RepID=A0A1A9LH43_9FLAO|nr:hypothetical protein [Aequorivita soesokkakensis]OAD92689.1 hypothetical protein A7A78_01915 [Aequorivita soesokkakensis]
MKKTLFALFVFFAIQTSRAQMTDLLTLANGNVSFFNPIFEEDKSIYGYLAVYDLGKANENENRFEYVILDTRLAKVANGEFLTPIYEKVASKFYSLEKVKDKLLLSRLYISYTRTYVVFTSHTEIDLTTNTPSETFYLEEGKFIDGYRNADNIFKDQKKYDNIDLLYGLDENYLSFQVSKDRKNIGDVNSVAVFGTDKKEKWETTFLTGDRTDKYRNFSINYAEKNTLIVEEKNKKEITLHVFDPLTGQKQFSYILENADSEYNYSYQVKKIGNELVLTGKISSYSSFGFKYENAMGLFKIKLSENGDEVFKKYFLWEEAAAFLEINKRGKLEKGYRLLAQDYFIFEDGRITFLAEKYKEGYNILLGVNVPKATDFVLFQFDDAFSLQNVETIAKDKSKFSISDYLFSQPINNGNDVVFFYRDYQQDEVTKDKDWVLGIVKLVDKKFDYEQIPMSSDDFYIEPYIAKEGFILLREYNKDSAHNKIRLERVNF